MSRASHALLLGLALALPACSSAAPLVAPPYFATVQDDALALCDALEARIASGTATTDDRAFAWQAVKRREEETAAYAFARAAIAGRLVQTKGLMAGELVQEVEFWARKSRQLDPAFRGEAATRMLGTLYALAPGDLLQHGNAEDGIGLLEELVKRAPDLAENHLRLAEALLAQGDRTGAVTPLCVALAKKASLRADEQRLADKLHDDAGKPACPAAAP